MKHQAKSVLPAKLAKGQEHFEQWRNQHQTRRRLPDHLWSLATELARQYGISRTARILRLDYQRLKRRSQRPVFKNCTPETPAVQFVDLISEKPYGHQPVQCHIECEQFHKGKIRVELKGPNWPDLTSLCRQLWNQGQ